MFRNFRIPAFAALLGATFLAASPAAAATLTQDECASQSGNIAVRAVAISSGATITMYEFNGGFKGQSTVEVFCRKNGTELGGIQNAKVKVTITPESGVTTPMQIGGLNGVPVSGTNPYVIGPFDGTAVFEIYSPAGLLDPGIAAAAVATHVEVVTEAWGGSLLDPLIPGRVLTPHDGGDILAQTPELDSLALFGSGACGILGYGLTRLRAARRRDS